MGSKKQFEETRFFQVKNSQQFEFFGRRFRTAEEVQLRAEGAAQ
jgi:hypothetical protein